MENIEALEKRLWGAADQLRANSGLGSNEYFMPVMGQNWRIGLEVFHSYCPLC